MSNPETLKTIRNIFAASPKGKRIMDQEFVDVYGLSDLKEVRAALEELRQLGELTSVPLNYYGVSEEEHK
jgi:hypothetical protein